MQRLKLTGMSVLYTLPALVAIFGLHDLSDYNHFVFGEGGIIVWHNVGVLPAQRAIDPETFEASAIDWRETNQTHLACLTNCGLRC